MPSPVGHALAGMTAGWLVAGPRDRGASWRRLALFGALGVSPDLDLLAGAHSGPTHSAGAALLVGLVFWAFFAGTRHRDGRRLAVACAAAYASHALLDWLGTDSTPPIGIMALWPFSHGYYESPWHLFMAVSRRYREGDVFVWHTVRTVGRELLILGPFAFIAAWVRGRSTRPTATSTTPWSD